MQCITTRFLGPTDIKGARIVAQCQAKRIVVDYDYGLSTEGNHINAAYILTERLNWSGELASGADYQSNWQHVFKEV